MSSWGSMVTDSTQVRHELASRSPCGAPRCRWPPEEERPPCDPVMTFGCSPETGKHGRHEADVITRRSDRRVMRSATTRFMPSRERTGFAVTNRSPAWVRRVLGEGKTRGHHVRSAPGATPSGSGSSMDRGACVGVFRRAGAAPSRVRPCMSSLQWLRAVAPSPRARLMGFHAQPEPEPLFAIRFLSSIRA